jgi:hypothetical protein
MFRKIAQGAFLLTLAVMIVSWVVSVNSSAPADSATDRPIGRMYS